MKRMKQIICILTASALLVLSPVSAFIGTCNVATVEAADVAVAGGSYLFEFLLALFGVSMASLTDVQKENAYGGYLQWVETGGDAEVYEAMTGYQTGDSVELTGSMVGSVSDYLKSVNANIISGTAGTVTVPSDIYMGSDYVNSYADISLRSLAPTNTYTHAIYRTLQHESSRDACYVYFINSSREYVYLVDRPDDSYLYFYQFDSTGVYYSSSSTSKKECYLYNSLSGGLTYGGISNYYTLVDSMLSEIYTTIPILQVTDSSFSSYNNLSLLLANSTCLNGENISPKYLITGNYSSKNVEAITGQTVSGSTITAVNSAVADAVGANTTTDESGQAVYTEVIAQAVADAVSKALEDSGFKVIEGGGGSETDPGDEENPDPLPFVPQIIEKIDEVGGAITSGFNNVINNITTTGEEIKNGIVEQIQSVLEFLFVPDLAPVQDSLDMIQGKFAWIRDIYDMFNNIFTSLSPDCEPPVVYIDFSKSESSKFVPIGKRVAVEFSWYAPYKPTIDLIVGGFLWVMYLWYIFKKLPDILNGSGMDEREGDD